MTFSEGFSSRSRLTSRRRRRQAPIFRRGERERKRDVRFQREDHRRRDESPAERRERDRDPRGMRRSTRRSITLWSTLCPGKLLRDAPVVDNFRLSDYTSVADDRATTASTTRFQIVVCGRSTSPKRKLTPTATMRSHHTPRCVPLRTRSSEVQVVPSSRDPRGSTCSIVEPVRSTRAIWNDL